MPDEQYQLTLGLAYARTPLGVIDLGYGSPFQKLLEAFALQGAGTGRLDVLRTSITATATNDGVSLPAFLGASLRAQLAAALARPETLGEPVVVGLSSASDAVDQQVGSVPFVRLHLVQAAIVDACRQLLAREVPTAMRTRLQPVAAGAFALAARLAFETHDDIAAAVLFDKAVAAVGGTDPSRRALTRSSQTMVTYYMRGDVSRARALADAAVEDARRGESVLMRARAHALQAEMAARGEPPQHRHAHLALHLAWHDLDQDHAGDPIADVFSKGRMRGFEGVCGIFLGEAEEAERHLAKSAALLTGARDIVQRGIVLTDRALARLHQQGPGAAESAADQLHECVDLIATTRGRVSAQRLRRARLELGPWRHERFVADLDDHIHTALIGI
ncbi:hypothetical protein [Actinomadura roseirufa]|uniref:hypothetical protein n=1 Tax=Actinomadura roseirufa TaxID=2094049 RepID=UPI001041BCDB|nr:hypothetical protein [Actinomadura roseirufa]